MTTEATLPDLETRALLTIAEFCKLQHISVGLYHKLRRAGKGPDTVQILNSVRISPKAAEEWRERNRVAADAERVMKPGGMSTARPDPDTKQGRPMPGTPPKPPRVRKGVQPTFPSGKTIGRPRKGSARAAGQGG